MVSLKVRHPAFNLRQLMIGVAGAAVLFAMLAWISRTRIGWWASEAFECSVEFFPQFVWLAAVGAPAAFVAAVADRRVWRPRSLWMLLPFAVPVLLLAFGMVFRSDDTTPGEMVVQRRFVVETLPQTIFPLGFVLLGCFRSVSNWIIILGVSATTYWLTLGAELMSIMSVTNIWL